MTFSPYPLKLYLRRLPNLIMFIVTILCNLAMWFWLLWYIRPVEDLIYLHYNILFGIDLTGPWYRVFLVPLLGLTIFLVNAIVGWFIFNHDKMAAYLLNAIALLSHFFLLISASLLVFLNV